MDVISYLFRCKDLLPCNLTCPLMSHLIHTDLPRLLAFLRLIGIGIGVRDRYLR